MPNISIVIITKNAARKLEEVLNQAIKISDDIVIIDSGSTDKTTEIVRQFDIAFHEKKWEGYGKQKNYGNSKAKYDWILSIDADEVISNNLVQELSSLHSEDEKTVYTIPFKNHYCGKIIKYGRWKNEHHVRLFNKNHVNWDTDNVHEGLVYKKENVQKLQSAIIHYSMESKAAHVVKAKKYAVLGAKKLHAQGKKASFIKRFINPIFRFISDYFFRLGFLDGALGFQIAYIISKETYWKYLALHHLNKQIPLPLIFN